MSRNLRKLLLVLAIPLRLLHALASLVGIGVDLIGIGVDLIDHKLDKLGLWLYSKANYQGIAQTLTGAQAGQTSPGSTNNSPTNPNASTSPEQSSNTEAAQMLQDIQEQLNKLRAAKADRAFGSLKPQQVERYRVLLEQTETGRWVAANSRDRHLYAVRSPDTGENWQRINNVLAIMSPRERFQARRALKELVGKP